MLILMEWDLDFVVLEIFLVADRLLQAYQPFPIAHQQIKFLVVTLLQKSLFQFS